tara:strand:+ start:196 stop:1602 length:1407 start_codon:yes stop_codon:yes gene_type:complete
MAIGTITGGTGLNSVPAPGKQTVASAYVDLRNSGWAQQYLPDLMEGEAEVFGNRTISGFLAQVGAEEAMASDQVVWSEQGRLHMVADGAIVASTGVVTTTDTTHGIRVGDTVVLNRTGVGTLKCYVSAIAANNTTYTVVPYTQVACDSSASGNITFTNGAVKGFVYGSEYKKGQTGRAEAIQPDFKSFTNKPVILKDLYEVSGSDASAIGWIEVSGEDGQNGYLWYLKAAGDTMARFTDYCEMTCIEGELTTASAGAATPLGALSGTEGLFAAVKARGNSIDQLNSDDSATNNLASFDLILAEFDKQGAIEENMMFLNRGTALAIDDMLAGMNSYGADGTSYGVFDNSSDMALNLGFSGFRRGSYDFYKSDWKYLNDATTRGAFSDIDGVIVPAGVSSVYDQALGKNLKRPFLHVRYRASQTESRKMKSWVTGSVGAVTSDLDAMEVNYLSERCLVTQGANNFMLLTA